MEITLLMPILIFVPLAVGFVLLFTPAKWKLLHKGCGLLFSALAFLLAIKIYTVGEIVFDRSILDLGQVKLNLLLGTNDLNTFILLFAMGFGLLISIYSLKDTSAKGILFNRILKDNKALIEQQKGAFKLCNDFLLLLNSS